MTNLTRSLSRRDGEGEKIHAPALGFVLQIKLSDEECGGSIFIAEEVTAPKGEILPHIHHRSTEFFYCLQGHYEFMLGDNKILLSSGGMAVAPAGTLHSYRNLEDSPGHLLRGFSPGAGMHAFLRKVAALAQGGGDSLKVDALNSAAEGIHSEFFPVK